MLDIDQFFMAENNITVGIKDSAFVMTTKNPTLLSVNIFFYFVPTFAARELPICLTMSVSNVRGNWFG